MNNQRKTDILKIEKEIQALIDSGKIKDEDEIKNMPIDDICNKLNICVKDVLCYFCYKDKIYTKCKECSNYKI